MTNKPMLSEDDLYNAIVSTIDHDDKSVKLICGIANIWAIGDDHVIRLTDRQSCQEQHANARIAYAVGLNPVETSIVTLEPEVCDLYKSLNSYARNMWTDNIGALVMTRAKHVVLDDHHKKLNERQCHGLYNIISPDLLARQTLAGMSDAHVGNIFIDCLQPTMIDFEEGLASLNKNVSIIMKDYREAKHYPHFQIKFNPDMLVTIADNARDNFMDMIKQPAYQDLEAFKENILENHDMFTRKVNRGWQVIS